LMGVVHAIMLCFPSPAIIVALMMALSIQLSIWDLLGIVALDLCGCVKSFLLIRSSVGFTMRAIASVPIGAVVPDFVILADRSPRNVPLLRKLLVGAVFGGMRGGAGALRTRLGAVRDFRCRAVWSFVRRAATAGMMGFFRLRTGIDVRVGFAPLRMGCSEWGSSTC
jgi:hypothetical protein